MMSWIELLHRCFRFVANAAAAGLPASSCTTIMSATSPDPGLHHHHHHHHGFGLPHLLYPTCSFPTKDFSNLAAIITSCFGSFSSSPPFLQREREREKERHSRENCCRLCFFLHRWRRESLFHFFCCSRRNNRREQNRGRSWRQQDEQEKKKKTVEDEEESDAGQEKEQQQQNDDDDDDTHY